MKTAQTGAAGSVDSSPEGQPPQATSAPDALPPDSSAPNASARDGRSAARPWSRIRPQRSDVAAVAVFALAACWVTSRYWFSRDYLALVNPGDQTWFEWELAHGAWVVTHLENPFFTTRINYPDGVNMMVNNSVLGLSIPFAWMTILFGPHVTFVFLITASLFATGCAWYYVLSRHVVRSRGAAFLGAALIGFGPGAISHAQGQLNLVTNFVLPFLVLRVLKMRDGQRPVRNGVILGLLTAYQVFISEEVLFITALACILFVGGYLALHEQARRWAVIRSALVTVAVSTAVAGTIIAYPVWFQFWGARHYRGIMPLAAEWGAPVFSYVRIPGTSVGGLLTGDTASGNEQNAFFGPILALLLVGYAVYQRRRPAVRALGVAAILLTVFSFGKTLATYHDLRPATVEGHRLAGPYLLIHDLPLFDALVPSRLALGVLGIAGIMLALACDDLLPWLRSRSVRLELGGYAVLAAALVPLIPLQVAVVRDTPIPAFITQGTWKRYVDDEHTLVAAPVPTNFHTRAMRWAASTNNGFRLENGYFLGPTSETDLRAAYSPDPRTLGHLVNNIEYTGVAPRITEEHRALVVADLRYWRAAIVVLTPTATDDLLRQTMEELLGPATFVDGVWMWDVRPLVDS